MFSSTEWDQGNFNLCQSCRRPVFFLVRVLSQSYLHSFTVYIFHLNYFFIWPEFWNENQSFQAISLDSLFHSALFCHNVKDPACACKYLKPFHGLVHAVWGFIGSSVLLIKFQNRQALFRTRPLHSFPGLGSNKGLVALGRVFSSQTLQLRPFTLIISCTAALYTKRPIESLKGQGTVFKILNTNLLNFFGN